MSNKYVVIGCLFVSLLLLSNIIAGKLIIIAGQVLPGAVILFPLVYLLGGVITEVYGFARMRLVIWVGFFVNIFMVLVFTMVMAIPSPDYFSGQEAYKFVLGMTPRVVVASSCAYWAGEFINSTVMSKMKLLTSGRWLWTRTISAALTGEVFDTCIFITMAFYGLMPNSTIGQMIIAQYIFKASYGIAVTPITYALVGWLKKTDTDVYDNNVSYNPFSFKIKDTT